MAQACKKMWGNLSYTRKVFEGQKKLTNSQPRSLKHVWYVDSTLFLLFLTGVCPFTQTQLGALLFWAEFTGRKHASLFHQREVS